MDRKRMHFEREVEDQPFCGGVIICIEDRLTFTLAKPKHWTRGRHVCEIPVAWVGGKQEIGESVSQCAQREAIEELGCRVELLDSAETVWLQSGVVIDGPQLVDPIRPAMIDLYPGDDVPFRPGLPTGKYVYAALYRTRPINVLQPTDVPGIVSIPRDAADYLFVPQTAYNARQRGIQIQLASELPENSVLTVNSVGPERALLRLWQDGTVCLDSGRDRA